MIQFKIQTPEGTLRISSPSTWSELNLEQLIKLEAEWDGSSILNLFSIITGVDVELLQNSKAEGLEDKMLAICAFAYDSPNWETLDRPDRIQIGDDFYKTPDNISKMMLGQKVLVSQIVIKEGKDLVSNIPKIIAICMQPIIDKKYDEDKVEALELALMKSPAINCYGLAKFFFRQSANSMQIGELDLNPSQPLTIPIERLSRGLRKLKDSQHLQASQ